MQAIIHGQKTVRGVSPELAEYIKQNIPTLQDLIIILNTRDMPSMLYSQLIRFTRNNLSRLIRITAKSTALPMGKTDYKFNILKKLNLTASRNGKLNIRAINSSINARREQRTSLVQNKPKSVKLKQDILVADNPLDLGNVRYGTSEWFDVYYSDAYWSPNDIKLGLD